MATTNDCAANALYESMTWCPGSSRMPGVRKRVYYIRKAFITKWPAVSKGKYTGDFTLDGTHYFNFMDVVINKSKFSAESQGEYPCKTFRQHLELYYPGLEEDITNFETESNNDDLVYLVQQSNGTFKVLGCEEYETDTTHSSDSGSSATDSMGVTITAECDAPTDLLCYEGAILTASGEDANENA